jgi:predicted RNase H-like HicB family nuclease
VPKAGEGRGESLRDESTFGYDPAQRCSGPNMRFEGKVFRDGRFWLAEMPLLDAMTQARTRKEALAMAADWLETMVNRDTFRAEIHPRGSAEFEISGTDAGAMTALLLRRRREASGALDFVIRASND